MLHFNIGLVYKLPFKVHHCHDLHYKLYKCFLKGNAGIHSVSNNTCSQLVFERTTHVTYMQAPNRA